MLLSWTSPATAVFHADAGFLSDPHTFHYRAVADRIAENLHLRRHLIRCLGYEPISQKENTDNRGGLVALDRDGTALRQYPHDGTRDVREAVA